MNITSLSVAGFRLRDGWLRMTVLRIRRKRHLRLMSRKIRATAIELDRLDDQILRDIGLARGSIESALHERAILDGLMPRH